jgi:hypothetical protein
VPRRQLRIRIRRSRASPSRAPVSVTATPGLAPISIALLAAEGVAVVFGVGANVRISYAAADELPAEACARIRCFCEGQA